MKISLKNYTLRYLTLTFLLILAVWAAVFYAYILDEVYDNIDDGLKDKKTLIIQNILRHPELLKINEFGIEDFRVYPSQDDFSDHNVLSNAFFYMPFDDEDEPYRVLKTSFYDYGRKGRFAVQLSHCAGGIVCGVGALDVSCQFVSYQ